MTLPRLLVIMGSGETAPTMRGPHRRIADQVREAAGEVDAVLLDTPFGFQENAPILAAAATKYFKDAVGIDVEVAGLARIDTADPVAIESGLTAVRQANWVFAGPGSPTFALRQWHGSGLAELLADKLRDGGAVVFSSAAALTLGVATVPVYEVYKVGVEPFWAEGLDLLSAVGINAAVIPHFDNAEGGNHDTRFCYLGERRLAMLEPELPDDAYVLGVDEHTGLIIDLDAETAEVVGKGVVTLRRDGHAETIPAGTAVGLDVLRVGSLATPGSATTDADPSTATGPTDVTADAAADDPSAADQIEIDDEPTSLQAASKRYLAEFDAALTAGDADAAAAAMLALESSIAAWSADTLQSDQLDQARAALRSMIVRLAKAASVGLRDPRELLGPVVEAALAARAVARAEKAYAVSDALRDGLDAAGIEVRDTPDGAEWVLR
jgi:cyanophycinase-like exopeptidase